MRQETREQFPKWSNFNDGVNYDTVRTNDLDSEMGSRIIEQKLGFKTGYFYDFKTLYVNSKFADSVNEKLYIDAATTKDKSIDNHVQAICNQDTHNENSVNINNAERFVGYTDRYYSKYCGSTLLTIISLLDIEIPEDEELQMILLAIDSTYLGFYGKRQYRDSNERYLKNILGFDQLYELQSRKTPQDFEDITEKYNLKTNIKIVNDKSTYTQDVSLLQEKLFTLLGIDITLSEDTFIPIEQYKIGFTTIPNNCDTKKLTKAYQLEMGFDIHSLAMTGKNNISYSYKRIVA